MGVPLERRHGVLHDSQHESDLRPVTRFTANPVLMLFRRNQIRPEYSNDVLFGDDTIVHGSP